MRACCLMSFALAMNVVTAQSQSKREMPTLKLAEKARRFEERISARHDRHGYVADCALERAGDLNSFVPEATDNDGLWTAIYVAAESFRYAVTKEPDARARAKKSLDALLWLEEVTGIAGFPARAAVQQGERAEKSRGEWHSSPKFPDWEWKGDTSSDEIVGHFFAFAVYAELVADDAEKTRIAATARRIMDHIISHDYFLVDLDGQPTRWGVWNPQKLNLDPLWSGDRGLNSLEILSHLRVTHHLTGDAKYQKAFDNLAREHGYAANTVHQKINVPGHVNHSDDELAFLSYYPLLRFERGADMRRVFLASLDNSWRIERPERCPLWNFIASVLSERDCDAAAAVQTLREIPDDLISWTVKNSDRKDIRLDAHAGRFGEPQSVDPLPYYERPIMKWNGNPYALDGGNGGRGEDDGAFYLLPYWMGRYFGYLKETD